MDVVGNENALFSSQRCSDVALHTRRSVCRRRLDTKYLCDKRMNRRFATSKVGIVECAVKRLKCCVFPKNYSHTTLAPRVWG